MNAGTARVAAGCDTARMGALIYLASPLGFTAAGALWREQVLLPAVADAGFGALDPWADSPATAALGAACALPFGEQRLAALRVANTAVAAANVAMLERCDGVLAMLDGTEPDSGTAAEVGFAFARRVPVAAVRTDLRPGGDNEATPVNLQLAAFCSAGVHATVPAALAALAQALRR